MDVPGYARKEAENPFKYDEDQIAEKRLALLRMKELWPNVSTLYAEWVYDICFNTAVEEIEAMKKRIDSNPSRFIIEKKNSLIQ